ncbi:MAG: DUF58 domain-containing protein [Planctomycetia bacterium]|nr:DUF58 domain-containing protein [Planctomycetia bacterium]
MNPNIFHPEILAQLGTLKLRAQALVDGMTLGEHAGTRRGMSADFLDHQPWEPGQDPKFIDWRAFARTEKFFQKRFQENANTPVYLLVDYTPEMHYRGERSPLSKLEYAQCLAAMIGFLATRQKDSLAAVAFRENAFVPFPLASGESHWQNQLEFLENPPFTSGEPTQTLKEILTRFVNTFPRRGLVFLFSDWLHWETIAETLPVWKQLAARREEVRLYHLSDPDEQTFPFDQRLRFVGMDGGNSLTTVGTDVRDAYLYHRNQWCENLQDALQRLGMEYHAIVTDTPLGESLAATQSR